MRTRWYHEGDGGRVRIRWVCPDCRQDVREGAAAALAEGGGVIRCDPDHPAARCMSCVEALARAESES